MRQVPILYMQLSPSQYVQSAVISWQYLDALLYQTYLEGSSRCCVTETLTTLYGLIVFTSRLRTSSDN